LNIAISSSYESSDESLYSMEANFLIIEFRSWSMKFASRK
jgi:hypothetical protein